ncbi:hypothetical protein XH83_03165 [Bradyrhizobium sp. CCBAU 53351]|nr:hypothetical protein XH83_03165 [Bradyrhizobium sp. CCBAU 53351]
MFIMGGKGSGKSHLMRHFSFQVQQIRFIKSQTPIFTGLGSEGYVGIYARCGGLNSHRFARKNQSDHRWADLFAYYFELWVADRTLEILEALTVATNASGIDGELATDIAKLFDAGDVPANSMGEIRTFLSQVRRKLDYAINNSSLTGRIDAEILITRGKLFFGIPAAACARIRQLEGVRFLYLLDEFENLTVEQQVYLNTLVRETEGPMSFKIGSRLYGFRTQLTLSGGELNREGSEYEALRLDERFRSDSSRYEEFARRLVSRRLSTSFGNDIFEKEVEKLEEYFEPPPDTSVLSQDLRKCMPESSVDRRHVIEFKRKLMKGIAEGLVVGPSSTSDAEEIIQAVSFAESPVLEKLSILSTYQHWFRSDDLVQAARITRAAAEAYLSGSRNDRFDEFVRKHKGDMVAQLLRENSQRQIYSGIKTLIRMSEGLPRALITTLKHIFDWSIYMQEKPFSGGKISLAAQSRGVSEAADWFLEHMLEEGDAGLLVRSSVDRLSRLFRANRFADKPVETSLIAFSVDEVQIEPEARSTIKSAIDTSILINVVGGQRERNSELVSRKLELNTMLSPRFDLPVARRGVTTFSVDQTNAIFVYSQRELFEKLLSDWEAKMTAPYFGRTSSPAPKSTDQRDLFE